MNDRKLLSFFITIQRNNPLDLVDDEYYPDEGWDEFDPRGGWQNANSNPLANLRAAAEAMLADLRAAAEAMLNQGKERKLQPDHSFHTHVEFFKEEPPKAVDFSQLTNSITAMQRSLRIGMSDLARQWASINPAASQVPITTAPKGNSHNTSRKKQARRKKKGRRR